MHLGCLLKQNRVRPIYLRDFMQLRNEFEIRYLHHLRNDYQYNCYRSHLHSLNKDLNYLRVQMDEWTIETIEEEIV